MVTKEWCITEDMPIDWHPTVVKDEAHTNFKECHDDNCWHEYLPAHKRIVKGKHVIKT